MALGRTDGRVLVAFTTRHRGGRGLWDAGPATACESPQEPLSRTARYPLPHGPPISGDYAL